MGDCKVARALAPDLVHAIVLMGDMFSAKDPDDSDDVRPGRLVKKDGGPKEYIRAHGWQTFSGPTTGTSVRRLTLITFNVWFDHFRWKARQAALLQVVTAEEPAFVCLQEVRPGFLFHLLKHPHIRDNYLCCNDDVEPYGVTILARKDMGCAIEAVFEIPLLTNMGRSVLVSKVLLNNGESLAVATVHFESTGGAKSCRIHQMRETFPVFAKEFDYFVLCGDFNFHSEWPEEEAMQSVWGEHSQDVWTTLRGDEPGFTEDTEVNRMLCKSKPGLCKQVRFDRIVVGSRADASMRWECSNVDRLGVEEVGTALDPPLDDVWISDHFGLHAAAKLKPVSSRESSQVVINGITLIRAKARTLGDSGG